MKQIEFVNNEIYHIYNRGVEKRDIFLGRKDKFRFMHSLFEFNDEIAARRPMYEVGLRKIEGNQIRIRKIKKPLVDILVFCLMPNHYHLLLRQREDGGITKFMRKLGTGYTNYFNLKYKRSGFLFQGRFKASLINNDNYFLYMPYYIHFNPLDLVDPLWRESKVKDFNKIIEFLESYRWSSFLDYIGQKNFPTVTQRDFLLSSYGDTSDYKREAINWLRGVDFSKIDKLILEN